MHAGPATSLALKPRDVADESSKAHPMWRKVVAGGMVFVFALTLAFMGLMLCIAPSAAP